MVCLIGPKVGQLCGALYASELLWDPAETGLPGNPRLFLAPFPVPWAPLPGGPSKGALAWIVRPPLHDPEEPAA